MIYHIIGAEDWTRAQAEGSLRPASLAEEGFVHASRAEQLLGTASRLFQGRGDLLVLALNPARLEAEVREEDLYGEGQTFPHVYGPIPLAAVLRASPLREGPRGFTWPPDLPGRPNPAGKLVVGGLLAAIVVGVGAVGLIGAAGRHQPGSLDGPGLYTRYCMRCHQEDGQGQPPTYPSLVASQLDQEAFVTQVRQGKGNMPAFSDLSPEEGRLLWGYVQSLKP